MDSKFVMKKPGKLYVCMGLNVLDGILSGVNFTILYFVMKEILDKSITRELLIKYSLILAGIFAIRLVVYSTGYIGGHIAGAKISERIRLSLGNKMKNIPLSKFTKTKTGQYISAVTSDITNYENILTHRVGDIVRNIALIIILILFMGYVYLPGGIIIFLTSALMFPSLYLSASQVKKYGNMKNSIISENVSNIVEYVTGIQTLRAYGLSGTKNNTVTDSMRKYSNISYKYEAKIIPIGAAQCTIAGLAMPAMILICQNSLQNGSIDVLSSIMEIMIPMFSAKLLSALFVDCTAYKNLAISRKAIRKVAEEEEEKASNIKFNPQSYEIEFDNVSFSYEKGEKVLENMSFKAENQKLTAIVGDSGSGKSTILNLISKYYEPDGGKIKIGGVTINDIESSKVLNKISLVDQDVFLFNDTIRNNIRYAKPDASDEEIERACKQANCHEFIKNMEKGYDTDIGENGDSLSGGQRQRLSIARAILKDSPILLLDEATASLDIENEIAVKTAILNLLKKKKTVIMIAHTLSIIKNADEILVVSDGKILERGKHDELINKRGKYYNMWNAEKELY